MSIKSCQIIHRYGEDDFSVWNVDVEQEDYVRLPGVYLVRCGYAKYIFKDLAINSHKLYFLTINKNTVEIITRDVTQKFIDKYGHQGCSVRGTMEDILKEFAEEV